MSQFFQRTLKPLRLRFGPVEKVKFPAHEPPREMERQYGPQYLSPRGWCDQALVDFVAGSSPHPATFNDEIELDDAALIEQSERELEEFRTQIAAAPPYFLASALSLLEGEPPHEWGWWGVFRGSEKWDEALEEMLGIWARLQPQDFRRYALPYLQNPVTRPKVLDAAAYAICDQTADKSEWREFLAPWIENPSGLTAGEIVSLQDFLEGEEKAAFRARAYGQ